MRHGMKLFVCLAAFSLFLTTCSRDESPLQRVNNEEIELSAIDKKVVTANNSFGIELLQMIYEDDPGVNVFISPMSVSLALGMTLNGAQDQTFEAMCQTLDWQDLDPAEINESYRNLIDLLLNLDKQVVLELANSIWCRQGFQVLPEFIEINRHYFDAEVATLNFGDPSAVETINGWISEKTHGRISDVLDSIDPFVVMYLINAIYFKGMWTSAFDPAHTEPDIFYSPAGTVQVPMMTHTAKHGYFATEEFQALDVEYGDGDYSMTIILPTAPHTLSDIMGAMTSDNVMQWFNSFASDSVTVFMPKFKLDYKILLNDPLSDMGMGIAFSDAADFRGISLAGGLFISRVIHQSFLQVNEEGTEAAAVTVVEVSLTSIGGNTRPKLIRLDHPFLFFIREKNSQSILFSGVLNSP
jgi:serpin B